MRSILDEIAHLRGKATEMRHLSAEHGAAGQNRIAAKLAAVANEPEQEATVLERRSGR